MTDKEWKDWHQPGKVKITRVDPKTLPPPVRKYKKNGQADAYIRMTIDRIRRRKNER